MSTTLAGAQMKTMSYTLKPKHLKNDGTADKRFKENRKTKPVVIPTKKDETPDMRYKASKSVKPKP
jgi:hypothetical protein